MTTTPSHRPAHPTTAARAEKAPARPIQRAARGPRPVVAGPVPGHHAHIQRTYGNQAAIALSQETARLGPSRGRPAGPDPAADPGAGPARAAGVRGADQALRPVVQRRFELGAAPTSGDLTLTPDGSRAGEVLAQNLAGSPLGMAANSPTAKPFGWNELWTAGHTLANTGANNSHYNAVRMHLWNGRLGGPGDEKWNLAPGPAQVNSAMSAGPEAQSKAATAGGDFTWLRTKVTYQSPDNGNANDFTSVIPNRIEMEWGYMIDASGAIARSKTTTRGAAAAPLWSVAIPQPIGALTATQRAVYTSWASGNTAALGVQLDGVSDQERAQAFDLVQHDDLKWYILLRYRAVFLGMDDVHKGGILNALSDVTITQLVTGTLGMPTEGGVVEQVLLPLFAAGHAARAQALFAAQAGPSQAAMITAGGWDLLRQLGTPVIRAAAKVWSVFRLLPDSERASQLDAMTKAEIDTLIGVKSSTFIRDLLSLWCALRGKMKVADRLAYVQKRVSKALYLRFKKSLTHQQNAEDNPPINMRATPAERRVRKPPDRLHVDLKNRKNRR